jgi:hypothetical protein
MIKEFNDFDIFRSRPPPSLRGPGAQGPRGPGIIFVHIYHNSQLAILSEQICLSIGYSLRFIGQESVSETLKEKKKNI